MRQGFQENYTGVAIEDIPNYFHFKECNFSRKAPTTSPAGEIRGRRLFPGDDTPRTFINCNLVNCEVPPGSEVINCNQNLIENDFVVGEEETVLNGKVMGTKKFYASVHYGKYNSETGACENFDEPIERRYD